MNMQASKVALVTGGSRGIGRAASYELARQGYIIAVHYRVNTAATEQMLAGIRERGGIGFLTSPASQWTTGQIIDASGGYRL
ncbi:SDR family NAD(P)-dependent oxidoreductase [Crenobacter sp. SG2305]|uniref:SDR family NAD(P)-dependent oxidoreductase n=1 Tax=Crenobacter oryzisoli TaxID=3056844 RepID=UPI0025AB520D|nr:SDR family NAD(P)-dependent oxidoreductase [Crenobacter sp. SG2305]MDN0085608.1 SDR family NAD(P)-dependent oxidoreductase [Crenobacter sp. SG2305]